MSIILGRLDFPGVILILAAAVVSLPLFFLVHWGVEYCCHLRARKFCRKNGLRVLRFRIGPAFDPSGIKTEFTLVELECLDGQSEQKLVRLLVSVFGIRKVLFNGRPQDDTSSGWSGQNGLPPR